MKEKRIGHLETMRNGEKVIIDTCWVEDDYSDYGGYWETMAMLPGGKSLVEFKTNSQFDAEEDFYRVASMFLNKRAW